MSEASDKPRSDMVRVRFAVEHEDDGWPPVDSEGIWTEPLGDDLYRVDNVPWFARELAVDDVVLARAGDDGVLWSLGRARWSGRRTIRVIPLIDGVPDRDLKAVLDVFAPYGVTGEGVEQFSIVALDVPADVDTAAVKALLLSGAEAGRWDFEESCIDADWMSA